MADNAHAVSLVIQQLLTTATAAETGQRGFLITGDETYLGPYIGALAHLQEQIASLRRLTADNAQLQQLIDRLASLGRAKFREMDSTISLRRQAGEDAARAIVTSNRGQKMMTQFRTLTSEIRAKTEPLMQAHIQEDRDNFIRVLAIASGIITLCVCCLVIATRTGKQILLESEERFHLLADFIPPMAWIADKTGWIFWYNQRWYDYTRTTPAAMEGWGWQAVHDPERLPAVLELWTASIASGQPFQMEIPLLGGDGVFRMFLTRVMPWKDKDGNIFRWFGTNTDIDELAQAQKQLRRANEELEIRIRERTADLVSTNKELESFAYSVSHDLRAPLRHIDGFAELLLKQNRSPLDEKSQGYLEKIMVSSKRMGRLIDDLLTFSRFSRGQLSQTSVDLGVLVEETCADLAPDTDGRVVIWTIGDLPSVLGDRPMLRVVLVNLLSNAVKYTGRRAEARIEIGSLPGSADGVTIFVRDNGVGFEMEYVHKLFQVFQRLHSEEYEGTGIGLATVRRIVERHGGRVWAEGAPEKGATFYLALPAA